MYSYPVLTNLILTRVAQWRCRWISCKRNPVCLFSHFFHWIEDENKIIDICILFLIKYWLNLLVFTCMKFWQCFHAKNEILTENQTALVIKITKILIHLCAKYWIFLLYTVTKLSNGWCRRDNVLHITAAEASLFNYYTSIYIDWIHCLHNR